MRFAITLLAFSQLLAAQTFPAVQEKRLWPDARGEIRITENGMEFQKAGEEAVLRWAYPDIQHFDRVSRTEFVLLSYEDAGWRKLGRDRQFRFRITSGELSDGLFETMQQRLRKPVTDRAVGQISGAEYELPVKHLHSWGGCEGRLIFTADTIYYQTNHAQDARTWQIARDIQSVWSLDLYQMELHVYENNRREFSQTRIFNFALKEPLDPVFYRTLKLKLYELESTHLAVR